MLGFVLTRSAAPRLQLMTTSGHHRAGLESCGFLSGGVAPAGWARP